MSATTSRSTADVDAGDDRIRSIAACVSGALAPTVSSSVVIFFASGARTAMPVVNVIA